MLCVGEFGVGLGEGEYAVSGRVWCGFGGVSVCCMWDSFGRGWGSDFLLCVGQFGVGLRE